MQENVVATLCNVCEIEPCSIHGECVWGGCRVFLVFLPAPAFLLMNDELRQASQELAALGLGKASDAVSSLETGKKGKKAAPPLPVYSGGKAEAKLSPGVKKSVGAITKAQEIFDRHQFSPIERAVIWFKENETALSPSERHKWLTFLAKHESPEIKAVEGEIQKDANISVTLNYQVVNNHASSEEIALTGKTIDIDEAAEIIGKPAPVPGDYDSQPAESGRDD